MARIPRPVDTMEIIRRLERRIAALESGKRVNNATVDGGALRSEDPEDGALIFHLGQNPNSGYDRPDGAQQSNVLWYRDTGELGLSIADFNPQAGNGYQQFVGLWDRSGNIILSDDTNTGWGLARPWITPGVWYSPQQAEWVITNDAVFQTSWQCWAQIQHPWIEIAAQAVAGAAPAATGEARIVFDGVVVAGPETIGTNATISLQTKISMLAHGASFGSTKLIQIQSRRLSGTGNVRSSPYWCWGCQS